jgi:hypothetical protein
MPRWGIGCIGVLVVLALIIALPVGAYGINKASPATVAFERAMNDQAVKDAAVASEQRSYFMWRVLPVASVSAAFVVMVTPFGILAALLLTAWGIYTQRRDFVIIEGIPVARHLALNGATLPAMLFDAEGRNQARIEAARNPLPRLPDGLRTYQHAPRLTDATRQVAPALPAPNAPLLSAFGVPSFASLLNEGVIGRGGQLLLGYDPLNQDRIWGHQDALWSAAICGLPGSGKTTTVRFLCAQSAMLGARFVAFDPHAQATDDSLAATLAPLASLFMAPPASDDESMTALLKMLWGELDARKHGGVCPPWIIAADEWTALMRRSAVASDLSHLVEAIAQEGRKFHMFALLIGQNWTVDAAGGSNVRDVLTASYIHRTRSKVARLLAPGIDGTEVYNLPVGHAFLDQTNGERVKVVVPNTTAADLKEVGRRLGSDGSGSEAWEVIRPARALEVVKEETAPIASTAAIASEPLDERATEVRAMIKDGKTATEIITALWGVKGGRAFGDAAREYQAVVEKLIP